MFLNKIISIFCIAGEATNEILGCTNYADVYGKTTHIGGIVGSTKGSVTTCVNYGNVSGASWGGAGIAANCEGNVTDCINNGSVTGTGQLGGIVGKFSSTTSKITGCKNTGTISGTSTSTIGGICGNVTIAGYPANLKTILETTNTNTGTSSGSPIIGKYSA